MMARIGGWLAGPVAQIPLGEPNPEVDARIAAVIDRINVVEARVNRLEQRDLDQTQTNTNQERINANIEGRVTDLEHKEGREREHW